MRTNPTVDMQIRLVQSDAHSIEVVFQQGEDRFSVYYKTRDLELAANPEAFVALATVPCLKNGWNLSIDEELSPRFLKGLQAIQELYRTWYPSFHRIEIRHAGARARLPENSAGRVGVFFSGGLDSFYTLLKHRDEITDLIFIHGFDVKLEKHERRARCSRLVREIGSRFDKRVIEIETNFNKFFRHVHTKFAQESHGSGLASVGHLLSPLFRTIYIASSYTYAQLQPWGSHPELDPLWSSEALDFIHDGCEADRVSKAELISKCDDALKSLRVCPGGARSAHNCGRCEKCIRTMINLAAVGALDRCTTFESPLDIRRVPRLLADDRTRPFFQENLRALERNNGDERLQRALSKALDRPEWRVRVLQFIRKKKRRWGRKIRSLTARLQRTPRM